MSAAETSLFPRGWFVIAWSSELPAGGVMPLRYFERDLVLFRTESGAVHVLDAHCPHLGAHLGHGGTVVGETVACPFHAWRFDGSGRCTQIPYAERIPPRATLRAWTVVERNGALFLWHDEGGGGPTWEVPAIEGFGSAGWTPWHENRITVATHPREIVENVADKAHFPTVHNTHVDTFENHYEGHCATQHTIGRAHPIHGGVDHFDIVATYHGPAFQISDMRGVLHSRLLLAHTPIDRGTLHLRFAVSLARKGPRTDQFAQMYVDNLLKGFHQDIAIWEHKVFREAPRLAETDGPLGRLRQWYRQFYRPEGEAAAE
jgi:3-ketosteroid 9alpha-monooxygenase subunit A